MQIAFSDPKQQAEKSIFTFLLLHVFLLLSFPRILSDFVIQCLNWRLVSFLFPMKAKVLSLLSGACRRRDFCCAVVPLYRAPATTLSSWLMVETNLVWFNCVGNCRKINNVGDDAVSHRENGLVQGVSPDISREKKSRKMKWKRLMPVKGVWGGGGNWVIIWLIEFYF